MQRNSKVYYDSDDKTMAVQKCNNSQMRDKNVGFASPIPQSYTNIIMHFVDSTK